MDRISLGAKETKAGRERSPHTVLTEVLSFLALSGEEQAGSLQTPTHPPARLGASPEARLPGWWGPTVREAAAEVAGKGSSLTPGTRLQATDDTLAGGRRWSCPLPPQDMVTFRVTLACAHYHPILTTGPQWDGGGAAPAWATPSSVQRARHQPQQEVAAVGFLGQGLD